MTTYLKNGGTARAQMLLFKHNQDETEKVKSIVEKMGATVWYRISRVYDDEFERPTKFPVKPLPEMTSERKDIVCQFVDEKFIYISASGEIIPCCHYNPKKFPDVFGENEELQNLYNISKNEISIYKSSIEKALKSPLFLHLMKESGTLPICNRQCKVTKSDKMFGEIPK